ncbi:MAG: hypothetical protein IJL04_01955 [Bacteroidales bacterium]|nr:hypothetical protein [Bacteroidales bacterium]MBQ6101037.1 hypothetical protein [Bacteroidales bacterium]
MNKKIPPDKAGLLITIVSFVSLFFCLDAKEPKDQGRRFPACRPFRPTQLRKSSLSEQ